MSAGAQLGWRRFDEIVERVNAPHKYTILLREHPLYLQGVGPVHHKSRYARMVSAPKNPLYNGGLGTTPNPVGAVVGAGGSIAASQAGSITSAIGLSTSFIPVVGAAIAIGTAIFAGLWQAHEQRLQEAKNENQAVNNGVAGVDQAMKAINQAYNSGQATAAQCIQALQQVEQNFWAEVTPVIQPGRNDCSGGGACPATYNGCSGDFGAACCVGCYDLFSNGPQPASVPPYGSVYYGIAGAAIVLQQGGGTSVMQAVDGSKYGTTSRAAYQLTWKAPAASSAASSAASNVSSAVDELTGGLTTAVSDVASGNYSGLLLLGAAALAAYLFL